MSAPLDLQGCGSQTGSRPPCQQWSTSRAAMMRRRTCIVYLFPTTFRRQAIWQSLADGCADGWHVHDAELLRPAALGFNQSAHHSLCLAQAVDVLDLRMTPEHRANIDAVQRAIEQAVHDTKKWYHVRAAVLQSGSIRLGTASRCRRQS